MELDFFFYIDFSESFFPSKMQKIYSLHLRCLILSESDFLQIDSEKYVLYMFVF